MAVRVERIQADIEAIARCTETPGNGATRPTFSRAWADARAYVIAQAEAAGCAVRTDAAGNVHARPPSPGWDAPAWLVGSHIDTVPHGGDYDGVAGVSVGLELLRSARDERVDRAAVELIVFAEEEGPTFGLGMLGSRAWVGDLDAGQLGQLRNTAGQAYLEAGAPYGVDAARLADDRLRPERYRGLIEVHIEQGPGMWEHHQHLAVVRAIAGRRQYAVTVGGDANHAGATAMGDRYDALAGAAEMMVALEKWVRERHPQVVTVGRLTVTPNAVNVIPSRVEFTVDYRGPDEEELVIGDRVFRTTMSSVAERRGLDLDVRQTEGVGARPMDVDLVERLSQIVGGTRPLAVSGALHDSAVLAPHLPTAMLFVPSKDGVSHNPAEFSRVEDVAAAADAVELLVMPRLRALNASSRGAFVAVCGRFFERSPWVAERAWTERPFGSVAQLYEVMCGIVRAASADEQLALIRAHPDLVGRLAREGRLTRESTGEQAAAGLDALSADEVAAFERHNAAYRERFGFPFVICARENRKDAILAAFPRRLANSREQEVAAALAEIDKIARLRMNEAIWE